MFFPKQGWLQEEVILIYPQAIHELSSISESYPQKELVNGENVASGNIRAD